MACSRDAHASGAVERPLSAAAGIDEVFRDARHLASQRGKVAKTQIVRIRPQPRALLILAAKALFDNSGTVDQADYDIWVAKFGQTISGASASTRVPSHCRSC
jgi:RNA:NAD 2'-phosphotransferase (TPT1/KptA family)